MEDNSYRRLQLTVTSTALQNVLIPTVSLSAKTTAGADVSTVLAPREATFLIGVFANSVQTTIPFNPLGAPLVVQDGVPFVLPGQHILIFPIGAIITGIWAVLGITTVMYGTLGRLGFREQYRKRMARAEGKARG